MKGQASRGTYGLAEFVRETQETRPVNRSYDTSPPPGELFREADELYKSLKQQLAGEECASWTHSDVEKHLESKGREILRLLYQSHLALRVLVRDVADGAGPLLGQAA